MLEKLFITRYLVNRRRGSVVQTIARLAVGGIGLGVIAMVVILSVMGGFDEGIKNRLLGVEQHLIVDSPSPLVQRKVEKLVHDNGEVHPFAKQDVIIRTVDGIFSGAVAHGLSLKRLNRIGERLKHRIEISDVPEGSIETSDKFETVKNNISLDLREIAVGADLATSLGIFEGDQVSVIAPESLLLPAGELPIFEKVKVAAILRTNVQESDSHAIFYNVNAGLRKLQSSASLEKGLEVRLKNPDDAFGLAREIKKLTSSQVQTWEDRNSALFYSLKMEKFLMSLFSVLTILVGTFSVIAVLALLVAEKQKDVGILKAMGATRAQIRRVFLTIGMALGMFGIVGGACIGLAVCAFFQKYKIRLPDYYYDPTVPVKMEPFTVAAIIALALVLTLLGAAIPASRIAKYEAIRAIRNLDE